MRAVGLDLSLTATGIAPVDGVTLTVQPGKGLRGAARLAEMRESILTLATAGGVPDMVVIEGPAYSRALGAGHHEAAGLWWQVVCSLHTAGIPYAVATPSTLKKYATGRGDATKADMRMALFQRAVLDLRDDNQVDAWWLRCAALDRFAMAPVVLPRTQRAALDKVEWPAAVSRG